MGDVEIDTPRDREGSFDPQLIPKRTKDVSGVEDKVLSMYAKGRASVIFLIQLKIFMDLRFHTKPFQISQIRL